jgi:hypothetical protein
LTAPAVGTTAPSPGPAAGQVTAEQRFGLQQVPKHLAGATAARSALSAKDRGANPYVSLLPDPGKADVAYWRAVMKAGGKKRAAVNAKKTRVAAAPLLVDEQEPDQVRGGNDTQATAQPVRPFGSGSGRRPAASRAREAGTLDLSAAALDAGWDALLAAEEGGRFLGRQTGFLVAATR